MIPYGTNTYTYREPKIALTNIINFRYLEVVRNTIWSGASGEHVEVISHQQEGGYW